MIYNVGAVFIKLIAGIYRTVARIYDLMSNFTTQTFSLTSNEVLAAKVDEILKSIYILIAVFMLFRITVTMIQYLIDPDRVSDKNTGAGKLITRVIVSLALVIAFPTIMDKAYELQEALLKEDSIIFRFFEVKNASAASDECIANIKKATQTGGGGTSGSSGLEELVASCELDSTSLEAIRNQKDSFGLAQQGSIKCEYGDTKGSCDEYLNGDYYINTGEYKLNPRTNKYDFTLKITEKKEEADDTKDKLDQGFSIGQIESGIAQDLDDLSNSPGGQFALDIASSFSTKSKEVKETNFIGNVAGANTLAAKVEAEEVDYDFFFSIICGIVLIVVFLILCIEVVIRNLKLLILQILAPVAFISYMNPNDKVLGNWFKKFISCYLDLFLKLFGIRLALYLVNIIASSITGGLERILIYIAIFLFAKTVPNLITDVLGIKDLGGSFKDSMHALKNAAFTGATATAGTIGTVGALAKGATIGQAARIFGSGFSGKMGNVRKNYSDAKNAATQRKAKGISWKDAQKDEFPWSKHISDRENAVKATTDNYNELDSALDGSVFASNKAMEQLDNLLKTGTVDDRIAHATDFGIDTSKFYKDKDDKFKKFDQLSTEGKLNAMNESWGEIKNLERAKVLVDASNAVANGNANDFQKNIVSLAQRLDNSENNVGVEKSGVSTSYKVSDEEKAKGVNALTKTMEALDKAKKHNKSKYQAREKTN